MEQHYIGSCLCGTVKFKVEGVFGGFFLCHCSHCRKDTGSAHAANLFSSTAKFQWLAGHDKVQTYNLPQTRHVHCFCSVCGSALPHVTSDSIVVPAGCLDTDLAMTPDAHIFVASRAAWDKDLTNIPVFDTFPQTGT